MISALWHRKFLVLTISAAAVVLGITAAVWIPPRYTAQAHIRGEFVAQDTLPMQVKDMSTGSMSAGPMSLDLVRVIETQSRLLQSNRVARRVAEQIGPDRLRPLLSEGDWLPVALHANSVRDSTDPLDNIAARLLTGLTVTSDPRAYLITVHYRNRDADLSILVANALAAELLRSARVQVLFQQRYTVQAQLSAQLTKFGEKHPRVAELRKQLAATEDSLQRQMSEPAETILASAGENVTRASAAAPSPTRAFVVSLALLLGLTIGTGVALWLERHKWWA
jgi:uncharacterized protein involved in exopolysaccharide biosynthesis